jgi:hypothetical protein
LLTDLTEEEKEKADLEAAIAKVEAVKEKEVKLKDGYECGIDPKVFDEMHSKLPQRNDPDNLAAQQTLCGPADGKNPTYLGNSSAFRNVLKTLQHPPLIRVKRAFDRIFKGVNSEKDLTLSENQPLSEPFNTLQTNPS